MKRQNFEKAYENVCPNEETKARMLENILSEASQITPDGCNKQLRGRGLGKYFLIAAIIVMMVGTIATATGLKLRVREYSAFSSHDGTIDYLIDLDDEVYSKVIPAVEVEPHFMSGEDAKHIATVLFGEVEFYEAEPLAARTYSKREIQEKLDRWSRYTDEDALYDLLVNTDIDADYQKQVHENINRFIERYSLLYEKAHDENPHKLCDWTFKNGIVYMAPETEWDRYEMSACNQKISAMLKVKDIPYVFTVTQEVAGAYRINNIHAEISGGMSPHAIDDLIFREQLCRTDKPSEDQILAAKQKAEAMLRGMRLGDWMVDSCKVVQNGDGRYAEYVVLVSAVPMFDGIPVIRNGRQELKNEPDVWFEFSADGELITFDMQAPVDVADSIYGFKEISFIDLLETARENLAGKTASDYSYIPDAYGKTINVGCRITVTDIEYSFNRIPDFDNCTLFTYVLGFTLSGNMEYYNKDNDEIIHLQENQAVLTLEGIDGCFVERR